MQQLQFEASWDKAIAAEDRLTIEKIFHETKQLTSSCTHFAPIREAINHKGELLVTLLVHNFTDQPLTFNHTKLVYAIHGDVIAEHEFTIPALVIAPHVSMPWTFIFPKDKFAQRNSLENGYLDIS